jgi:hypothetical protein
MCRLQAENIHNRIRCTQVIPKALHFYRPRSDLMLSSFVHLHWRGLLVSCMDKNQQAIWNTLQQYEPHGLTYRQVWAIMPYEVDVSLRSIRAVLATMQERGLVRYVRGRWHAVGE